MNTALGVDHLTYNAVTGPVSYTLNENSFLNNANYYGVSNMTDSGGVTIFEVKENNINEFINYSSVLGGGGNGTYGAGTINGGHAINIENGVTVTTLNNYGALLGGGGSVDTKTSQTASILQIYGGAGGGGAGNVCEYGVTGLTAAGGSIVSDITAGSGTIDGTNVYVNITDNTYVSEGVTGLGGAPGGGPSGNGGNSIFVYQQGEQNYRSFTFGGLGGKNYGTLNKYGLGGGAGGINYSNGKSAGINNYNLTFGGGGGGFGPNGDRPPGGGYGGGNGCSLPDIELNTIGAGGGGGGGGFGGLIGIGGLTGGNGGYSIYNSGTIETLNNAQGGTVQTITGVTGAVMFPYGPLFLGGTGVIDNYNMIITDKNNYGQLWYTGWGAPDPDKYLDLTGSTGFTVSLSTIDTDNRDFVDFEGTNIFYLVLVNVDPTNGSTSGTITNSNNTYTYSWELITAPLTVSGTTYTAYHLAVTNTSSLTNFYATTQVTGATGTNDLTKQFKFIPYYTS